jgi:hypothetical protein
MDFTFLIGKQQLDYILYLGLVLNYADSIIGEAPESEQFLRSRFNFL